jgi:Asp-tRNA(Asn)/Glu-tRNA(Gln) amidotransferase A subunit family amidase
VKDNLDTAGIRTTGGSIVLDNHTPSVDATVVARLRNAGAIILGKTNMHELAFGITNNNPHYGPVRNPYDLSRISGGSSGGSGAAVTAGLCCAAIGTDTGGSIRIPAALCGCVGLKPSLGRVGRGGLMYLSSTCDCIGPITRCVMDAAMMLEVMAGPDERDTVAPDFPVPKYASSFTPNWEEIRLGVPRSFFYEDNDPQVAEALETVLEKMEAAGVTLVETRVEGLDELVPAGYSIVITEAIHLLGSYLEKLETPLKIANILDRLGPDLQSHFGDQVGSEDACPVPGYEYLDAVRTFRDAFKSKIRVTMAEVDALVTPTTPLPATPIGDDEKTLHNGRMVETFETFFRYTFFANLAGLPAITVPADVGESDLPIGVQFVGKPWGEAKLLNIAWMWESIR